MAAGRFYEKSSHLNGLKCSATQQRAFLVFLVVTVYIQLLNLVIAIKTYELQ